MSSDRLQLAFQAHLAEYSALRQELLELVKWRDRLVFLSLGVSGALFSFALTAGEPPSPSKFSRYMALYLIAPLAFEFGGLYIVAQRRIYRIGIYLRERLAPNVNSLLAEPEVQSVALFAFSWEFASRRERLKWWRHLMEGFVLISAFSFSGLVSLGVIYSVPGVIRSGWFMLTLLWVNWFSVASSLALFLRQLWLGREKDPSKIYPP